MDTRKSNILKIDTMDAKTIRNSYIQERIDGQNFFWYLREAIKKEFLNQGYCDYMEELVQRIRMGAGLYIIEYAVIEDLYQENTTDPYIEMHVPYITYMGSRYPWHMKQIIKPGIEEDEKIVKIKITWRGKHLRKVEALQKENERLKKQPGMGFTEKELEDAKRQADEILRQARLDGDMIRRNARKEAETIREEARQERVKMLSEAAQEYNKMEATISQEAVNVPDRDEAFSATGLEREKAETVTSEGDGADIGIWEDYFEKRRQELRREHEQWSRELEENDVKVAEIADKIHGQMCDETNAVQAQLGSKLNETIESLRDIESAFFSKLYAWQTALYPRDMEPIGRHYINLYSALNMDKLIKAEAVFQMNQGDKKPAMETVEALEKLELKLQKLLKKYERALQGLGLYVQFPQEGELFDDVVHSCSSDPDETAVITKCITPAIIHKMVGEGNEKTVIKAEVEVRTTGKEAMSHEYHNV